MVENEAVFRKYNRKIQHGYEELQKLAKSEGEPMPDLDMPMHFYCECADENCRERIAVSIGKYKRLHQNKKHFIVIPGHEVSQCEFVIKTTLHYTIVEKYMTPPETAITLNATSVENA